MTVSELIEILERYSSDIEILIGTTEYNGWQDAVQFDAPVVYFTGSQEIMITGKNTIVDNEAKHSKYATQVS